MSKHRNFFRKTGNAILCQLKPEADVPHEQDLMMQHLGEKEQLCEAKGEHLVTFQWVIQN